MIFKALNFFCETALKFLVFVLGKILLIHLKSQAAFKLQHCLSFEHCHKTYVMKRSCNRNIFSKKYVQRVTLFC